MRSTKSRSFNYAQRERALALIAAIVTSKNLDFYRHSLVVNGRIGKIWDRIERLRESTEIRSGPPLFQPRVSAALRSREPFRALVNVKVKVAAKWMQLYQIPLRSPRVSKSCSFEAF